MGPLVGMTVIEMAGIGPTPLCGMLLSDLGAKVISIQKRSTPDTSQVEIHERGKTSVALNLKSDEGLAVALSLIESADALIEGFRPGVMERLGLGPDVCLARNPRLVYGRMTGWGQTGPMAHAAGHDINYIALTGALHAIGPKDGKPVPPLNLVGDNGGGALYLAFGLVCGLLETKHSGKGQVIDVSMVDGTVSLMTLVYSMMQLGLWQDERGSNLFDGGAPFYDTYETKDGKHISLGSIEPQFYAELVRLSGVDESLMANQYDISRWPDMKAGLTEVFKQKTRDEWDEIMFGKDVCYAPVLSMTEAPDHPHNQARGTFIEVNGLTQPGPAPKYSRTKAATPPPLKPKGSDTDEVLRALGHSQSEIDALRSKGVLT